MLTFYGPSLRRGVRRVVSAFQALQRGRQRRQLRQRLITQPELLEDRTLLAAAVAQIDTPLVVVYDIESTANQGSNDAYFADADDVMIDWGDSGNTDCSEVLIYNVETGQQVDTGLVEGASSYDPNIVGSGTFQIFVRGTSDDGQTGQWSSPVYARIADGTETPGSPTITAGPDANGDALQWTPGDWSNTHEVLIYSLTAGQQALSATGVTGNAYTPTELLDQGDRYQAFVRGAGPNGQVGAWSNAWEFDVNAPSQIPQAPTVLQSDNLIPPTITWQGNAPTYDLLVYSTSYGAQVLFKSDIGQESYTVNELAFGRDTYQAFIRGVNAEGEAGLWGGPLTFSINANPSFPDSPSFTALPGADSSLVEWTPVSGAATFELHVYRTDLGQLALQQSQIAATQFDVNSLLGQPGAYSLYVRAFDGANNPGGWSTPAEFDVVAPPADPVDDGSGNTGGGNTGGGTESGGDGGDTGTGDTGSENGDTGSGGTGSDPGSGGGGSSGGDGSGGGGSDDPFQDALVSFHGADLTGKDGEMSATGLPLTLLYHEHLAGQTPSNTFAPLYRQFTVDQGTVLIDVDADDDSTTWQSDLLELNAVNAGGEGSAYGGNGDDSSARVWLPINAMDDLAAFTWLVDASGVYSVNDATEWVVGLTKGASPSQVGSDLGVTLVATGIVPGTYTFQVPGGMNREQLLQRLQSHAGIAFFNTVELANIAKHFVPNDTFYGLQWHLENTGQTGGVNDIDIDAEAAWDGATGAGVQIGIVDEGVEYTHQDLAANYDPQLSQDFVDQDSDPFPANPMENHGTSVAGLAAAVGNNNEGVTGTAFNATFGALRILGGGGATNTDIAKALTWRNQIIDVYNNSWGFVPPEIIKPPTPFIDAAIAQGAQFGRGGLGGVYVFSAGNGGIFDNVNYTPGTTNSRWSIPVAAIGHNGVAADYSTPGASLFVGGPSAAGFADGMVTTDTLASYTGGFNGTSASAPVVSGIVALMLEANPNLTWRDVQHIIVRAAEQNDPNDPEWTTNGAGFPVHHRYGFGLLNANRAVQLAQTWVNVDEELVGTSDPVVVAQAIPDVNPAGASASVEVLHEIDIETVQLTLNATHTFAGDLTVKLTSPDGTESLLADIRIADATAGYVGHVFNSRRHWGESSAGTWTVEVIDGLSGDVGTFDSFQLFFYGTGDLYGDVPPGWGTEV